MAEADILDALDEACRARDSWPVFRARHPDRAYHSLRSLVFRQRGGDGWLLLFECLEGSSEDAFCLKRYVVARSGSFLLDRSGRASLFLMGGWDDAGDNEIMGPCASVVVRLTDLLALEPRRATAEDASDMLFTLLVRAYLTENPTAFWTQESGLRAACASEGIDLGEYRVLLDSTEFEHIVGHAEDEFDPDGIDSKWRILPSASLTYQSLARALVGRDESLFEPGPSNLSWRLHLDAPKASRRIR